MWYSIAMSLKEEKKEFILNELWKRSIDATLRRNIIYVKAETPKQEKLRDNFTVELREDLKSTLEHAAKINAQPPMTEERLIEIITNTARKYSRKYKTVLADGRFRIGSVQKIINLYLKYLWTTGYGSKPPHCPFDRKVLLKLHSTYKPPSWTKMNSMSEYKLWVKKAQEKAAEKKCSIAEWELTVYNEVMNTDSAPAQAK